MSREQVDHCIILCISFQCNCLTCVNARAVFVIASAVEPMAAGSRGIWPLERAANFDDRH